MRKNKPYREWYANSRSGDRTILATLQFIEGASNLLDISAFNLIGTGMNPSDLYKISSKLDNLHKELIGFHERIESKIEAADKKHELRKAKQQNNDIYINAANKIITKLNMYIGD